MACVRVGYSVCAVILCWRSSLLRFAKQFRDADKVVSDEVEHEDGRDVGKAAQLRLTHRAVLLAPIECCALPASGYSESWQLLAVSADEPDETSALIFLALGSPCHSPRLPPAVGQYRP